MLPVVYMYMYLTNTYQQHSDDVIYPTQQGWEMEMAIVCQVVLGENQVEQE